MHRHLTFAGALVALVSAHGAKPEDSWNNLKLVTRDGHYTVAIRAGKCINGHLAASDGRSLTLESSSSEKATESRVVHRTYVPRADVIWVADRSPRHWHDLIYSGRSSWNDVKDSQSRAPEYLKVITKSRGQRICRRPAVTDTELLSDGETIKRPDIRRVYYVRPKPMTDWEIFASQEGAEWVDPKTWFNYLLLGRIVVLLYDSEVIENNAPTPCK